MKSTVRRYILPGSRGVLLERVMVFDEMEPLEVGVIVIFWPPEGPRMTSFPVVMGMYAVKFVVLIVRGVSAVPDQDPNITVGTV